MQHRLSPFLCSAALRHANGDQLVAHRHLSDPEVRQNATGPSLLHSYPDLLVRFGFVRGDNLATLCQDFRDAHLAEDFFIISNKVAMLTETMTHAKARG